MVVKRAQNEQWSIENATMENGVGTGEGLMWDVVRLRVDLRRKPQFFVLTLVVPSCMIASLMIYAYFLPVESGEKVLFGVNVLLGFSVFQIIMAEQLPKNSDTIPIISEFIIECDLEFS